MRCPTLGELPPPPSGKTGWPWTEESPQLPETMPDGSHWPRVSIVTPSYNQGQFIEESIRSVLLQGYPDLEYIVIDGGSTDNSVEVIRKYEPWIAYWVGEPDRGQSHAINKGLARSSGQLFNWHNADDVLTPGSVATTAAAMASRPQASHAWGDIIVIDSDSSILFHHSFLIFNGKAGFMPDLAWSVAQLKTGFQPGCLMDRALALTIGGVDENLFYNMDTDLQLRLSLIRPAFYVGEPVAYFRKHGDSKSFSLDKRRLRARDRLLIAHKLFNRLALPPEIRKLKRAALAKAHHSAASNYVQAGMYRLALRHAAQTLFYSPVKGYRITGHTLLRLLGLYEARHARIR